MKSAALALSIVFFAAPNVLACTCVVDSPPIPACQEIGAKKESLFIGKVDAIDSRSILLPPDNQPFKMQMITFNVLEHFGGLKEKRLVVMDWPPGNGSCGYKFVKDETYLVDALLADREEWHVNSCGYTSHLDDSEDLVRFLRANSHDKGASLFGTVKEYVGERNFVAKRNKPIADAKLVVDGPDGSQTIQTDSSGWYMLHELNPGEYVIRLEAHFGDHPDQVHKVELQNNSCAQVDFRTSPNHVTPPPP